MSVVARTVWMIESRFREPLALDEMAAHSGVSPSHLSRLFPIATGYSISAYVRGRRLSEAAKRLAEGDSNILGLALDIGYGSHEAFTRAFRALFEITPDEVRRRRSLDGLHLVEPIMMPDDKTQLEPPRIEAHPALRLAGLSQRYDPKTLGNIPDQWTRFAPYIGEISGGKPGDAYGVLGRMDEVSGAFDYFCGVPVPATSDFAHELLTLTLPAGRYARFTHHGHISTIRATCAAIFGDWLPSSGKTLAHGSIRFLEYYGPDFDARTGLGTVEIWLPLKG
jgi:AraC family transcriptional regulator